MRIIEEIVEYIDDELKMAEDYIDSANKYKDEHPEICETFIAIANDEMKHSEMLHSAVVRAIDKHKMSGKEVPAEMIAIWNYEHKNMVKFADELRHKLETYKKY
jgi:rubrerythrin